MVILLGLKIAAFKKNKKRLLHLRKVLSYLLTNLLFVCLNVNIQLTLNYARKDTVFFARISQERPVNS